LAKKSAPPFEVVELLSVLTPEAVELVPDGDLLLTIVFESKSPLVVPSCPKSQRSLSASLASLATLKSTHCILNLVDK
jgi:hypothetical protein